MAQMRAATRGCDYDYDGCDEGCADGCDEGCDEGIDEGCNCNENEGCEAKCMCMVTLALASKSVLSEYLTS